MISARMVVVLLFAPVLSFATLSCGDEEEEEEAKLPLCSVCVMDADCDSGTCKQYGMGQLLCSNPCDAATAATACPSPALGTCNGMGFCACP